MAALMIVVSARWLRALGLDRVDAGDGRCDGRVERHVGGRGNRRVPELDAGRFEGQRAVRATPGGQTVNDGPIEGSVNGDTMSLRTSGSWEFQLMVQGDEMSGTVVSRVGRTPITLRRSVTTPRSR